MIYFIQKVNYFKDSVDLNNSDIEALRIVELLHLSFYTYEQD